MSNIVTVKLSQIERTREFIAYASFESEPNENNRAIAINLDVIKQELDSLFSTHQYERPYLPDYYNPLDDLIGELWKPEFATLALQGIVAKVNKFIPRITVDSTYTTFTYENHKVNMELVFYYNNDFNHTLYSYTRQFDTVT